MYETFPSLEILTMMQYHLAAAFLIGDGFLASLNEQEPFYFVLTHWQFLGFTQIYSSWSRMFSPGFSGMILLCSCISGDNSDVCSIIKSVKKEALTIQTLLNLRY